MSSLLQGSFAKMTYNFKEPTNGSHLQPCCHNTLNAKFENDRSLLQKSPIQEDSVSLPC